jgi:hypothetical protein
LLLWCSVIKPELTLKTGVLFTRCIILPIIVRIKEHRAIRTDRSGVREYQPGDAVKNSKFPDAFAVYAGYPATFSVAVPAAPKGLEYRRQNLRAKKLKFG